jgi:hypothetical protein
MRRSSHARAGRGIVAVGVRVTVRELGRRIGASAKLAVMALTIVVVLALGIPWLVELFWK